MATMFWLTRATPEQFDPGAAAGAGLVLLGLGVALYLVAFVVLAVLGQLTSG